MKISEWFDKEWHCIYVDDPCGPSSDKRPHHEPCGWRYEAVLLPEEFDLVKDMEIV